MGEGDSTLVAQKSYLFLTMKDEESFRSEKLLLLYASCSGHCHVTLPYQEIISFFDHCHVTFSDKENLSFFGHCHETFPYKEPLSFFGKFVQKVRVFCFSDSFDQKTTQQSDGSCIVTSDFQLLYQLFKKVFLFVQTHMKKNIVSKEYCIARHDDKMCLLPKCIYRIILIGDI